MLIEKHFEEDHGVAQLNYLKWKSEFLLPFSPKIRERSHETFGAMRTYYSLWTARDSWLAETQERWYVQPSGPKERRRKVICKDDVVSLTPEQLAVWFMDDGCYERTKRYVNISVCAFTEDEVHFMQSILDKRFGLSSEVHGQVGRLTLYFSPKQTRALFAVISPTVKLIPTMNYKVGEISERRRSHVLAVASALRKRDTQTVKDAVRLLGLGYDRGLAYIRDMSEIGVLRTSERPYGGRGRQSRAIKWIGATA